MTVYLNAGLLAPSAVKTRLKVGTQLEEPATKAFVLIGDSWASAELETEIKIVPEWSALQMKIWKEKQSHNTPMETQGERRYSSYSFKTSAVDGG
jgi:hypothetical protein